MQDPVVERVEPPVEQMVVPMDERIIELQKKLKEAGYDPGKIDGIWGEKTRAALNAFQKDNGLAQTSPWEPATIEAVNSTFARRKEQGQKQPVKEPANKLTAERFPMRGKIIKTTFLMRTASILADSLVEIPAGTVVELQKKTGDFFLVAYRGHKGYVYVGLVEKGTLSSPAEGASYFTR